MCAIATSRLEDAVSGLELHLAEQEFIKMAGDSLLVLGMATCNELNIIKDVIHGASLDEKKFSSTGWVGQRQSSLTLIVFLKDMCQAGVQRWGSEEAT